uniref:Tumor protein p53-inducible protein 11 n=1 Tax=Sus scrofa TaxID=9823 RepID=A0A8D1WA39_PIG
MIWILKTSEQPPPLRKKHSPDRPTSETRKSLGVGGRTTRWNQVRASGAFGAQGLAVRFCVLLSGGHCHHRPRLPDRLYQGGFRGAHVTSKILPPPRPLHRGAVLSIFLIVWDAFYTAEKVISRWTLLTEACEFGVQGLAVTATLPETGLGPLHPILPPPPSRLLFLGPWASGSPRQTPMEEPESRGRRPIFLEEAVD